MNQEWWDKFVVLTEELEESDMLAIIEEILCGIDSINFHKKVAELTKERVAL